MPNRPNRGPLLIAIGALLWSTDALFRTRALQTLQPSFIVFCEHAISALILLPWMMIRLGRKIFALTPKNWIAVFYIGAGASAFATLLFTWSFTLTSPSIVVLLQKLQPIVVILLAIPLLRESPPRSFYPWAGLALLAALGVSFTSFDWSSGSVWGAIAAGGAALIWATATVAGKSVLRTVPFEVATFWRFFFGTLALGFLLWVHPEQWGWSQVTADSGLTLFYLAMVSGLVAMLFYYSGLARTQARIATLVELLFPVGAVILNYFFLHATLTLSQLISGVILLFAVFQVSFR